MRPLTAGLAAVGTFFAAALLALSGAPQVVVLHLVFAAAVLPLILAAILHFVPVLTRTGGPSRGLLAIPAIAMLAGWALAAMLAGWLPAGVLPLLALLDLALALLVIGWIVRRARATLGAPHPGYRWYVGSLAMLAMALLAIATAGLMPESYRALRALHLHLNTLGFIGMAAFGTLPVLVPTALGKGDPGAAAWLARWVGGFAAGCLLVAGAAAVRVTGQDDLAAPLVAAGVLLVAVSTLQLLWHWFRNRRVWAVPRSAAVASLIAAAIGFELAILLGLLHGLSVIEAMPSAPAFVGLFLLPLVSGALTQLLPVWRLPGPETAARRHLHSGLGQHVRLRLACFQGGGLLFAAGVPFPAILAMVAGVALFAIAIARSLSELRAPGG